jgi:hypothetical protein
MKKTNKKTNKKQQKILKIEPFFTGSFCELVSPYSEHRETKQQSTIATKPY